MKAYLALIVYLFGSCALILAMEPASLTLEQQNSDSLSASSTSIQELLIFPQTSSAESYGLLSPQGQHLVRVAEELAEAEPPEEQRGLAIVVNEVSLARELLEYDHREKQIRRSDFILTLFKYAKQYPQGSVWSSVQARLGDMHREMAKEALMSEKFKLNEQAKRYYLSAYAHGAALPEAKSWAAVQLGYICLYGCKYVEAQQYFKKGQSHIKPVFLPSLYNGLGVAYYCLGKKKEADKYWTAVTKSDNQREKGRAYHNLAILSADFGNYIQAIEWIGFSKSLGHPYAAEEFEQLVSSWKSSSLNSPISF